MNKCRLCKLEKITTWHFEEEKFVVIDCDKCRVPMYVWRSHVFPVEEEVKKMIKHVSKYFPEGEIDFERKAIPEHYHFHIR